MYVLGNGEMGTRARILQLYPSALTVTHVAGTDPSGECLLSFDPLSRLRSVYDIDPALDEGGAFAALEARMNQSHAPVPSPQERIAAALEYQNMLSLAQGGDVS